MATQTVELQASLPEEAELKQRALSLPEQAKRDANITDARSYGVAANTLLDIATMRKRIIEHHRIPKLKAHEAHQAICDAEAELLTPIAEAERILKSGIGAYDMGQRRIREAEERKSREEAERASLEMQEQVIEEMESSGASAEEIQAVIETPMVVARPVVRETPKVSGVSTMITWRTRLVNRKAFLQALAAGHPQTSDAMVEVKMGALDSMARSLKGSLSIPGVEVYTESNVRAGGRR